MVKEPLGLGSARHAVATGASAATVATAAAVVTVAAVLLLAACASPDPSSDEARSRDARSDSAGPAILLVTLDTTRADVFDLPQDTLDLPTFRRLDEQGLFFTQAYATAPMTGPSHASMLTGLYPAGHGIHENGRFLAPELPRISERMKARGAATAAFVSAYPLASRFGWAQGFDRYDDDFGLAAEGTVSVNTAAVERSAADTTDRATDYLKSLADGPSFTWVHYFDPHEPYEPPEPFRSRYPDDPYRAEIAALDPQLDRLLRSFEAAVPDPQRRRVLIVGDHGEGRGDHGEALHGNLLYQEVLRVPLWIVAPGVAPGRSDTTVSVRQVYGTLAAWAGLDGSSGDGDGADVDVPGLLDSPDAGIVLAEAMKPYLQYGWQPQTMAVRGRHKLIYDGAVQLYDLIDDPGEHENLYPGQRPDAALTEAVRDYPVPEPGEVGAVEMDDEARRFLAALGYVGGSTAAPRRPDAPRPIDMVDLFDELDRSSGLFVREQYRQVVPLSRDILARDPDNLMVRLRLAASYSLLGEEARADAEFERAAATAPESIDLLHYRALHALRFGRVGQAERWLEDLLQRNPRRVSSLKALAQVRELQGKPSDAAVLLTRALEQVGRDAEISGRLGGLWMHLGETDLAISAFEDERLAAGRDFGHELELGVLYLAAGRVDEAAATLDRVPANHPGHAMALFKRAQASVLLGEPDREERIRRAWEAGDAEIRGLMRSERLFEGLLHR